MYARHISPISRRKPEISKEGEGNGNAQAKMVLAFRDRSLPVWPVRREYAKNDSGHNVP